MRDPRPLALADALAAVRAAAGLQDDDIYHAAALTYLNWELGHQPGPPYSASGQLEHTRATAPARRGGAILVAHQSASKRAG